MHLLTRTATLAMTLPGVLSALQTCPSDVPLSCHNSTAVPDSSLCCFSAPGGVLLQTQFWDAKPATGPDDSWTIHGLWYPLSLVIYIISGPMANKGVI